MKVLLTGASGFIGRALLDRLPGEGHEIHGLYERPASWVQNPLPAERRHIANLTDHTAIEALVRELQPEVVVHLAARTEVALSFANYLEVGSVNYLGTVNLAESARRHAPLRCFLMASTMETYGRQQVHEPFTEATRQHPMAPYAVAKLACERYLEYMGAAYDFPFVTLRQTNTYGRPDNAYFVVERVVSQMLHGPVCDLGEPWPMRNFLWIGDLIDLYCRVLRNLPIGETFVTGPTNALRIDALVNMVREKLAWGGTVNWHTLEPRPGEIAYLDSDPAKAQRMLGWAPRVSLSDGLDRTIELWRARFPSSSTAATA